MDSMLLENGLALLTFARGNTTSLLEDIPRDKVCHQLTPGGNHALWVVGHLTVTDDGFLAGFSGRESACPQDWQELFGMGSTPGKDPAYYPGLEEISEALHLRREALLSWFKSLDDEQLRSPLPDDWKRFAPNYAGMMSSLAWHEGLHAGQLTMIRRSLNIGPKFA